MSRGLCSIELGIRAKSLPNTSSCLSSRPRKRWEVKAKLVLKEKRKQFYANCSTVFTVRKFNLISLHESYTDAIAKWVGILTSTGECHFFRVLE